VYDMYPWAGPARPAAGPARPGRAADPAGSPASDAAPAAEGARAVQVALDRRDNGGDAVAAARKPAAGPTRQ
jgi:hypothetical protein